MEPLPPASAQTLARTCATLSAKMATMMEELEGLRAQYTSVALNTGVLIAKSQVVAALVEHLHHWLGRNEALLALLSDDLRRNLREAVAFCRAVVDGIQMHIARLGREEGNLTRNGTMARSHLLWNEALINDHVRRVDSQITSLTHLLQVIQLPGRERLTTLLLDEESLGIRRSAREDAMSYRTLDYQNGESDMEFDFDEDLVQSMPYIRQYRSMARRQSAPGDRDSSNRGSGSTSTETPETTPPDKNRRNSVPAKSWKNRLSSLLSLPKDDVQDYSSSLLRVTEQGNHARIQQLLHLGADVNYKHRDDHEMPLHKAARNGDCQAITMLIQSGAKLDPKNKEGMTPLHIATKDSSLDVLNMLLSSGALVDVRTNVGVTPLHSACLLGDSKKVESLLDANALVNLKVNGFQPIKGYRCSGYTPVHMACASKSSNPAEIIATVQRLIEAGATLDATVKAGRHNLTPLQFVVLSNRPFLIPVLLEAGANPNVTLPLIIMQRVRASPLKVEQGLRHSAAQMNSVASLKALDASDSSIGVTPASTSTSDVWTPLHAAAFAGSASAAAYLLEQASPTSLPALLSSNNKYFGTPLHTAALKGFPQLAHLLLAHGADAQLERESPSSKETPFHFALRGLLGTDHKPAAAATDDDAPSSSSPTHRREPPDHLALLRLFHRAGANMRSLDIWGEQPVARVERATHLSPTARREVIALLSGNGTASPMPQAQTPMTQHLGTSPPPRLPQPLLRRPVPERVEWDLQLGEWDE